jgi:hypothetical protein
VARHLNFRPSKFQLLSSFQYGTSLLVEFFTRLLSHPLLLSQTLFAGIQQFRAFVQFPVQCLHFLNRRFADFAGGLLESRDRFVLLFKLLRQHLNHRPILIDRIVVSRTVWNHMSCRRPFQSFLQLCRQYSDRLLVLFDFRRYAYRRSGSTVGQVQLGLQLFNLSQQVSTIDGISTGQCTRRNFVA